jgi:hypothetical protein
MFLPIGRTRVATVALDVGTGRSTQVSGTLRNEDAMLAIKVAPALQ